MEKHLEQPALFVEASGQAERLGKRRVGNRGDTEPNETLSEGPPTVQHFTVKGLMADWPNKRLS